MIGQIEPLVFKKVFNAIPSKQILEIATTIQKRLKTDRSLQWKKMNGDLVTDADIQIQNVILQYFSNSSLGKEYSVKAEEKFSFSEKSKDQFWQLLIDPLDGTSSFAKGQNTWGVMVGACRLDGTLAYSWNLVAAGDVFTSSDKQVKVPQSFKTKLGNGGKLAIDVYDYGSTASEKFGSILANVLNISKSEYTQTSYPSAVWAGWQLCKGNIDGLLWLCSDKGKKSFPDYDLIFLGAVAQQGYSVRLGKINGRNSIIAIGPSDTDADALYQIGLQLITSEQRKQIVLAENPLQLTTSI